MASKVALVAFLLMLSLAGAGAHWLGSASNAQATVEVAAAGSLARQGVDGALPRTQHIFWNGAIWLFGLGLAITLSRSGAREPALE